MAIFRSFSDLVISYIEHLRLVQPELDVKPGTVSRDLFIDAQSQQLAGFYNELRNISGLQSLFSSSGNDLNRWASNLGIVRSSGADATGVAVFTTNNMDADVPINQGSIITASNGISYKTLEAATMFSSSSNVYRANATRFRSDLDLLSNTDKFAIEVNVESLTPGTSGNIGRFSLTTHNIIGISNVANLQAFSGGSNAETDSEFRTRILSIFAGSNTGTALGYRTAISTLTNVNDSIVVVPGDPLLTRDGTQTIEDSSGNLVITENGTGGKVDIYVLGTSLQSEIDSSIYNDKSGKKDPTNPLNDIILGQRGEDPAINAAQRRVILNSIDTLPFQPIENIISVVGSSSGPNFIEKFTDSFGSKKGNFELVKDTGDFSGSPFGFDKIHFISNTIALDNEQVSKGVFNGTDALNFSDVEEIRSITQDILITNENSTTDNANRNQIILNHFPIRTVSRIINRTTGERYVVVDQNPDGTAGELNTTGKILISGSTLPVSTDILQVDYIWVKPYDNFIDFDNLKDINTLRTVQDSVDWGFGNLIVNEPATVDDDGYGNLTITLSHPISKILSVNTFESETSVVSNGTITASEPVVNIIDVRRIPDNAELFNTDKSDGVLSGTESLVLPSDSLAEDNDSVDIRINASDLFMADGYDLGTFLDNIITLPRSVSIDGTSVLVNYIANVSVLLPEVNISDLPVSASQNKFLFNDGEVGEQPTSNLFDIDNNVIYNLRRAVSNLSISIGSSTSNGSISISGTTVKKVTDALIVVTAGSGFEIDVASVIKKDLGTSTIPSSVKVVMLKKIEKVTVNSFGQVASVSSIYDTVNYKIQDNSFDLLKALEDSSLSATQIVLPQTTINTNAELTTGNIIRVTFYYANTSDAELLFFSRNGEQITNKLFSTISRISLGAGFQNPSGQITGTVSVNNYNQPISNTSYDANYDYVAPKENERITITFNHNQLINQATSAIERVRPITADVLVKAAKAKDIDVNIRIVLLSEFTDQEQTVIQDAIDAVTSFLSASSLGTTIDASDVVNVLYTVNGVDRVQVINFSTINSGNLLSITAKKNEYLRAGTITITKENR